MEVVVEDGGSSRSEDERGLGFYVFTSKSVSSLDSKACGSNIVITSYSRSDTIRFPFISGSNRYGWQRHPMVRTVLLRTISLVMSPKTPVLPSFGGAGLAPERCLAP